MIITDIKVYPVQAPGRTLVPVVVETDSGLYGVGEAGLQRRPLAIQGAVEHLKRFLIGENPMRIEHLWQRMSRGGFYPADRLIGSAVSAIDIALWDIKGKYLKVPVYELLGGLCRDYVQCYTHVPGNKEVGTLKETIRERDAAFVRLSPANHPKYAKGVFDARGSVRESIRLLKAVREEIGEETEIIVDLHAKFDPDEAIRFCREAEPYHPYFVEDLVRAEYRGAYRHLRQQVPVPIAAGEHLSSKWEFMDWIEHDWIDFARIDICIVGGLTEAKKIAGMCEAHYIKIAPHNPLGPVCTAAELHLDLTCTNFGVQEVAFHPDTMLPNVFATEIKLDGSRLLPPTAPGIGVEFDPREALKHPFEFTEPLHLSRPDGSFTNG